VLYADVNLIHACSPLTTLSKLSLLSLSCNNIRSVQFLDQHTFPLLRVLNLSFNQLDSTCLSALQRLCHLETLNLSGRNTLLEVRCNQLLHLFFR
jgi:Leucine-rich repeat (LRR) protein